MMIKPSDNVAIISGERQITFSDMLKYVSCFAKKSPKEPGSRTLIVSENREGWIFALYAVWNNHGIVVPVDASSTAHDIAYVINDCKPDAVWTSAGKRDLVCEAMKEAGEMIPLLIIDDYEQKDVEAEPNAVITYEMEDTCLICYTSGTTGSPKGVMLSFRNVMANVNAVSKEVHIFNDELRTIVLLPLHHVLPLVGTAVIPMLVGGGVAICPSLAAADIMGTLQHGRIGLMIGVPRLWQTLFRRIKGKIDSNALTRALYNLCDKVQSRWLSRLVFGSVRRKMGGAIKYCVSGGAPLDYETACGLRTLGLDVLEGYGMTEAAPMITFTRPDDILPGSVGLPVPSVEVKLVDGELCARGKNVMQGYYHRPEETAAIIDKDGFLHTGDLATIDEAGRITITGRKKEIIVLSNGKNVNPSEIEEKLERYDGVVKEAAVVQDGDLLRAIIVPQAVWKSGKSIVEMEESIKQEVLQPYNETVAPYKKLMGLLVYQDDLPRTRLDKLQRFKLQEILHDAAAQNRGEKTAADRKKDEPTLPEYKILKEYLQSEKKMEVEASYNLETDLAMDSLDKVSLQGFIELTFGMNITVDQITSLGTVIAITEYIAEQKTRMEVENIDWHTILTQPAKKLRVKSMPNTGLVFTQMFKMFNKLMFRAEAHGQENIPTEGPVIFAPNHQSYIDAPLVISTLGTKVLKHTYFYAKKEHVHGPIARFMAKNHNIIVMDMRTLKDSIQMLGNVLNDGRNLIIFPEGTRTPNGNVGVFKKTFAILSKELGVPVVPIRIKGAFEAWPRTRLIPFPRKVTVQYLPAVTPLQDETYDELAERVRKCVIEG